MSESGNFREFGSQPPKNRPDIETPYGAYRFMGNLLALNLPLNDMFLDTYSRSENRKELYADLAAKGVVFIRVPSPAYQLRGSLIEPFAIYRRQELTVAEVTKPEVYLNKHYPGLFGFEQPTLEDRAPLDPATLHFLVNKAINETGLADRLTELNIA